MMLFVDVLKCCVMCNFQLVGRALCEHGYTIIIKGQKNKHSFYEGKTGFDRFQVNRCANLLQPSVTIKTEEATHQTGFTLSKQNGFPMSQHF